MIGGNGCLLEGYVGSTGRIGATGEIGGIGQLIKRVHHIEMKNPCQTKSSVHQFSSSSKKNQA